jgi:hypothetical protein
MAGAGVDDTEIAAGRWPGLPADARIGRNRSTLAGHVEDAFPPRGSSGGMTKLDPPRGGGAEARPVLAPPVDYDARQTLARASSALFAGVGRSDRLPARSRRGSRRFTSPAS